MARKPQLIMACVLASIIATPVGGYTWAFRVGLASQREVLRFKTFKLQKIVRESGAVLTACSKMCVIGGSTCPSISLSLVNGDCKLLNRTGLTNSQGTITISKINEAALPVVTHHNSKEITSANAPKKLTPDMRTVEISTSFYSRTSIINELFKPRTTTTFTSAATIIQADPTFIEESAFAAGNNINRTMTSQSKPIDTNPPAYGSTTEQPPMSTNTDLFKSMSSISGTSLSAFGLSYPAAVDGNVDKLTNDDFRTISVADRTISGYSMQSTMLSMAGMSESEVSLQTTASSQAETSWSTLTWHSSAIEAADLTYSSISSFVPVMSSFQAFWSPSATLRPTVTWISAAPSSPIETPSPKAMLFTQATSDPKVTSIHPSSSASPDSSFVQVPTTKQGLDYNWTEVTSSGVVTTRTYCGSTIPEDYLCCNGVLGKKFGALPACCGTTIYNSNKDQCCLATVYDDSKETCCNGTVKLKSNC